MSLRRGLVLAALSLATVLISPAVVWAETAMSISIGASFTQDHNTRMELPSFGVPLFGDNFDESVSLEARYANWKFIDVLDTFAMGLPRIDLGIGASLGYFRSSVDLSSATSTAELDFNTIPFAALAMVRFPILTTDERPNGLVQPYIMGGPAAFLSIVSFKITQDPLTRHDDDVSINFGWLAKAGVNVSITKHISVFAEYGYSSVHRNSNNSSTSSDINSDLQTHHALVGVGYHF